MYADVRNFDCVCFVSYNSTLLSLLFSTVSLVRIALVDTDDPAYVVSERLRDKQDRRLRWTKFCMLGIIIICPAGRLWVGAGGSGT